MAQKILVEYVTETRREVPSSLVDAGWKLLPLLQEASLNLSAAFWQFLGQDEGWRLVLSTPLVQTEGPLKVVRVIQKVIADNKERTGLDLSDILLQSPVSMLVQNVVNRYRTVTLDKRSVRQTTLSDDEAYVYLL